MFFFKMDGMTLLFSEFLSLLTPNKMPSTFLESANGALY